MEKRLCNENEHVNNMCNLLQNDEGIHINQVLHAWLDEYDIHDLQDHYECTERNCGVRIFSRLFSYLKLFRDIPSVQDKINDPNFPVTILAKFVIYLMNYSELVGEDRHYFIDKYLSFLSVDRFLELIIESEQLGSDADFLIHAISRLDNQHMDGLLAKSARISKTLTDMFLNSPEEEVKSILSRNPILFDYVIMFLELDGRNKESENFTESFGHIIETAKQVQQLVKEIKKLNSEDKSLPRGDRISHIVSEIMKTEDWNQTFDIMLHNGVFLDQKEQETIKMLLRDTNMQDFLHLGELKHYPEERMKRTKIV